MIAPPSLEAAGRWPDRPALSCAGRTLRHGELAEEAARRARRLAAAGVRVGDRVALWGANSLDWAVAAHAVGRAGAVLVPVSPRWTDAEAAGALGRLAPRLVLGEPELAWRARQLGFFAMDYAALAAIEPCCRELPAAMPADAPMALLLTSGTTGAPKAVTLSWGQQHASALAVGQTLALTSADRWWLTMPLFHVGGLGALWRSGWHGAEAVIAPRFEATLALDALAQVTIASLVPTMLQAILAELGDRPWPAALRAVMLGGAPVSPALAARCPAALATYGLTEAGSTVTLVPPGADAATRASCGLPIPGSAIAILGPDGQPLGPGAEGQIALMGPTVMSGYWEDAAATAAAISDGWLLTGDHGRLDEAGRLTVLSRREDLIVSGGENVYPAEIESALAQHPAVAACAVVPMADATWGQVPFAWVVAARPVAPEALGAWLAERLARFKLPRAYGFVAELPLLANGKIDRQALRRQLSRV